MNITKIEEPENLGNNLFRVKAIVHIKATVWGTTNEVDKEFKIIVYNGKFIYPEDL